MRKCKYCGISDRAERYDIQDSEGLTLRKYLGVHCNRPYAGHEFIEEGKK